MSETVTFCKRCVNEPHEVQFIGDICAECYREEHGEASLVENNGILMPKFDTIEEMMDWMKKNKGTPGDKSKPVLRSNTKSRSQKKVKHTPEDNAHRFVEPKNPFIYKTQHFYLRPGDKFGTLKNDAREEKKYAADGVLFFVHDHAFTEACPVETPSECTEI